MRGLLAVLWCVASVGCSNASADRSVPTGFVAPFLPAQPIATPSDPIEPLPVSIALDPHKVALGARLFLDPRLSGDGSVACVHCHAPGLGGANGARHSALPGRKVGGINVPTVFNSVFDFRYGWNGRFETLEAQLDFAMGSAAAMAGTWTEAWRSVSNDPSYARAFEQLYPEGSREDAVRDALVVYVRSLITPNARFDRKLRGEATLSPREARGYQHFRDYGCISCHQGVNVGGNMFQRFGVMRDYFADRGEIKPADLGLFDATGDENDRFVFRVPSLRNVELTAPYFHDGSAVTLEDAAKVMARYQLGRELEEVEATEIAAFLRTLTGELPTQERRP